MDANSDIIDLDNNDENYDPTISETETESELDSKIQGLNDKYLSETESHNDIDTETESDKDINELNTDDIPPTDSETNDSESDDNISSDSEEIHNNDKKKRKQKLESEEEQLNIIQAYMKRRGQLIILISGLSASGKTKVAKTMSIDYDCSFINQNDYYVKDFNNEIELVTNDVDGKTIKMLVNNYDTDDAIDWNKFNDDIDKRKDLGVIVCGSAFPSDKIKFTADLHIHIKLSKQNCLEKRRNYILNHKKDFPEEWNIVDKKLDSNKMNKYTYPYYMDMLKRSTITRYINANDLKYTEIYDSAYQTVIEFVKKNLGM